MSTSVMGMLFPDCCPLFVIDLDKLGMESKREQTGLAAAALEINVSQISNAVIFHKFMTMFHSLIHSLLAV